VTLGVEDDQGCLYGSSRPAWGASVGVVSTRARKSAINVAKTCRYYGLQPDRILPVGRVGTASSARRVLGPPPLDGSSSQQPKTDSESENGYTYDQPDAGSTANTMRTVAPTPAASAADEP